MLNIGKLDELIVVELRTSTAGQSTNTIETAYGDFGEVLDVFGDTDGDTGNLVKEIYAEVIQKVGRETSKDGREQSIQLVDFRIRYDSDITTHDRVKWDGKIFDIVSVVNKRRFGETMLTTESVNG